MSGTGLPEGVISDGTARNWARLNTSPEGRLKRGANKRLSARIIIPAEYFSRAGNIPAVTGLCDMIRERGYDTARALRSVGENLLCAAGIADKNHVIRSLAEYGGEFIPELLSIKLPSGERDLPGLMYQCLLTEGEKNRRGAYFTPRKTAAEMTAGLDLSGGRSVFDPCCGSGAFLLCAKAQPDALFGLDSDPVSVMLARINLLLRFKDREFIPQIYCGDFLGGMPPELCRRFDYIVTNPPWGAETGRAVMPREIKSGESFSGFLVKSFYMLTDKGRLRFLLPEAALNVRKHYDLRRFMTEGGRLRSITLFSESFSGVTSGFAGVELSPGKPPESVIVRGRGKTFRVDMQMFFLTKHRTFCLPSDDEARLIRHFFSAGKYTLENSVWALGIVTGDNKNRLRSDCPDGYEPIYTGKEVGRFFMLPPVKYIRFDRSALQQAADERVYRAKHKLIYRFVSGRPVFARDTTGTLCLNSANVLIPDIPSMSADSVLAVLNSSLVGFVYSRLFGDIKILKGNLCGLVFPDITRETDEKLSALAMRMAAGDTSCEEELERAVCGAYGIEYEELLRIICND